MWKLRRPYLALLCAGLLSLAGARADAAAPESIRIATSHFPPLAQEDSHEMPGALVEMVVEMLKRNQQRATIEFVPWNRAVYMTGSLNKTAVFPLTRSPEREQQYRWLVRLYHEQFLFMKLKGARFNLAHPERNKQARIGVLRGSLIIKELKDNGYVNLVEAASLDESMRFLQRGIVEAVCGNRTIFRAALKGRVEGDYVMGDAIRTTATWLGGSLDFTEADAAQFQKTMRDMIDDGTYNQILKKYDLAPGP